MLAVLITLTPGSRNEFIDCQKAKVCIAVLPTIEWKTRWNSTLELLKRAYHLREFTREWLQNPKYSQYLPLFTTQDEWMIVKFVFICKKYLRPGVMAPSEWTCSIRAVRDTPVEDYSAHGFNPTHCVPYRPPIAVSPFLLALSVSYFKRSLWRCGQL